MATGPLTLQPSALFGAHAPLRPRITPIDGGLGSQHAGQLLAVRGTPPLRTT